MPTLLFGSAVAGVPFAPLNYRLADDRLQAICARIAPAILIADHDAAARVSGIDGITVITDEELADRLEALEPASEGYTDPDQVAIWLFTSGTTGEPKAALLRHRHLVSYVLSTIDYMAAGEDEATLVSVPPYHIAAMATILSSVYSGRRIMYLPQFEPKEWVQVADQEGITHAMVVPTMLSRILDAAEEAGSSLPALHHLSYGGGRMPVPIIERAMNILPQVGYVNAYGLTETSSTVAVLGPEDHRAAFASDDPRSGPGWARSAARCRRWSWRSAAPMGRSLPPGETGEIYVRGDQIAGEYHGRSALDAEGWFATNDGGHLDEAGFLFVEGRLDDVIVRGGENMSPGEIEDVLLQHPGVADAAVVGVPDEEWGEVVAAAIVLEPGSDGRQEELQSGSRDHLRSSRMPAVIEIREALPYNETGKLLRRVLKVDLTELAKQQSQ